jgi:hypothetical protein
MMKKRVFLAFIVCAAAYIPAFGQETYTLLIGGNTGQGTITAARDRGGKITITGMTTGAIPPIIEITRALCPLIPAGELVVFLPNTQSVIIDGNTTTRTNTDGSWSTTVVSGNTKTTTFSSGNWLKEVTNGNTTINTYSDGGWSRRVVSGNTTTITDGDGSTTKTVVNGNTTTFYMGEFLLSTTVVNGNTTTVTSPGGGWIKTVVDKQGYTIFITQTRGEG